MGKALGSSGALAVAEQDVAPWVGILKHTVFKNKVFILFYLYCLFINSTVVHFLNNHNMKYTIPFLYFSLKTLVGAAPGGGAPAA